MIVGNHGRLRTHIISSFGLVGGQDVPPDFPVLVPGDGLDEVEPTSDPLMVLESMAQIKVSFDRVETTHLNLLFEL